MKQAFPSLSPELKHRLEASGFKPIKTPPLNDWYNPNSSQFQWANISLITIGFLGRYYAQKCRSPTILWSSVILAVPLFTLVSKVRIDRPEGFIGHRKTLEERLDYNPLTRNAYEKAVALNNEYQQGLRKEISELELLLKEKKL